MPRLQPLVAQLADRHLAAGMGPVVCAGRGRTSGLAALRLSTPPALSNPHEARFDIEVVLLSWALPGLVAYIEALSTWLSPRARYPLPLVGTLARRPEAASG